LRLVVDGPIRAGRRNMEATTESVNAVLPGYSKKGLLQNTNLQQTPFLTFL
jgi:hypothetical protein